jgi:hypothetical protein
MTAAFASCLLAAAGADTFDPTLMATASVPS